MKTTEHLSKIKTDRQTDRQADRENALMPVTGWICHSIAKRPDWAMKARTALTINMFLLFDIFGSSCRRVVIFSKFAGSLNTVFCRTCITRGQCRM